MNSPDDMLHVPSSTTTTAVAVPAGGCHAEVGPCASRAVPALWLAVMLPRVCFAAVLQLAASQQARVGDAGRLPLLHKHFLCRSWSAAAALSTMTCGSLYTRTTWTEVRPPRYRKAAHVAAKPAACQLSAAAIICASSAVIASYKLCNT